MHGRKVREVIDEPQAFQELLVFRAQVLAGPQRGLLGVHVEHLDVHLADGGVIVVAGQGQAFHVDDLAQALVRLRAVAHDVA